MKCNYCSMEWNGPSEFMKSIRKCPFCQKPIVNTEPDSTLQEVLLDIVEATDIRSLQDGTLLLALFSDFAPTAGRDKRLLRALIECGGNIDIFQESVSGGEPGKAVARTINRLMTDFSLAEDAAREVCQAFLFATGGSKPIKVDSTIKNDDPQKINDEQTQLNHLSNRIVYPITSTEQSPASYTPKNTSDENSWVCSCGYRNIGNRRYCVNCDLPSRKAVVLKTVKNQGNKSNYWVCSCGFRNTIDHRYCENCDRPKR